MKLPFEWRKNPIFLGVEQAKETFRQVARGERTIGLVGGGASTGKTTLSRQECRRHGIKYVPEERPSSAESLVSMTWRHVELPVHVLNECDHILRSERAMNVLKLMHEEPRKCSYYTKEGALNEERLARGSEQYRKSIPPTEFALGNLCRQILTTNLNYQSEEVTSQLPKDHWLALLRRGIDPVYIEIGGSDGLDLFQYTMGLVVERQMLRSHQFKYEDARDAVAFFVQNVNRLVDITPARLVMIAAAIRDSGSDQTRRNQRLGLMLRETDQRPKLRLEQSTVQVLLWPRRPPKRKRHDARQTPRKTPQADTSAPTPPEPPPDPDPPPAASQPAPPGQADREPEPNTAPTLLRPIAGAPPDAPVPPFPTDLLPVQPVPKPDPVPSEQAVDTQAQVIDTPTPEPPLELPLAVLVTEPAPVSELTIGQAINAIYALDYRTCDRVADILERCPLEECDNDELAEMAHALEGCSEWYVETVQAICHTFAQHAEGTLLYCTRDEVLLWESTEKEFQIYQWDKVRQMMAPHIAAAKAKQRVIEARKLFEVKLPAKRKLKVVKERLDQLSDVVVAEYLKTWKFGGEAQRAIEHIRQMRGDDERYSECQTLRQYVGKAMEIT